MQNIEPIFLRKLEQLFGAHAAQLFASSEIDGVVDTWMDRELPTDLAGMTVLDVGCGSGRWFPHLLRRGSRRIIGIDASRPMLAALHGHEIFGLDALAATASTWELPIILIRGLVSEVLPALPLQVDLAFASFSLCVMDEPQEALAAMHAVLAPGGQALISTNVIVPEEDMPTGHGLPREFEWARQPACSIRGPDGRRKDLLSVLHFRGANLPVVDKAHILADYAIDPQKWRILKAHLLHPSPEPTFVDGEDRALQKQHYGHAMENALSLQGISARQTCLCLKLERT